MTKNNKVKLKELDWWNNKFCLTVVVISIGLWIWIKRWYKGEF
jgi:hypothetical protein